MGEKDLAGFDDCADDFAEIDTDTLEHVRHSAYWAVNTGRGQDWEEPSRWIDIESFLQSFIESVIVAHVASVGTDLEEVDPRVLRAVYRVEPGEHSRWFADVTTQQGTVLAEGDLQPLPQDAEQAADDDPAYQVPVSSGIKTLRQLAVEGGTVGALFPYWITGPNSGKIVYSIGLLLDMATEWLYLGIQQRLPLVADEGALPHLGRDLGILRGLREATDAYRRRLSLWVPTHRRAGTPFAILEQAQAYFAPQSPNVYLVQHDPTGLTRATWSVRYSDGGETTIVETPSNWDWDSDDAARPASLDTRDPRVWLIIEQPSAGVGGIDGLFVARTGSFVDTSDANGMNGATRPGGGTAPNDQWADLQGIVQQWRAMGTWVAGVLVYFGDLDPGGSGAGYPDANWFNPLNDTLDGRRVNSSFRFLYVNRYEGDRVSDDPYEV